jgi:hypothetical protein
MYSATHETGRPHPIADDGLSGVTQEPTNPNDATRVQILQYFFDRNQNATSRFGKKGSAVKISDVKRELKTGYGLTQQQVMSNLTYLIDRGWVKTVPQEKTVSTRGGTSVPSVVTFYEITAQGMEKIEGPSQFEPPNRYPGININAIGANVVTVGDGNYVNVRHEALFKKLSTLKAELTRSDMLLEAEKLSVAADIETVKDQLIKEEPDRAVVAGLWPGIERAAAVAGLTSLALDVGQLIQKLAG